MRSALVFIAAGYVAPATTLFAAAGLFHELAHRARLGIARLRTVPARKLLGLAFLVPFPLVALGSRPLVRLALLATLVALGSAIAKGPRRLSTALSQPRRNDIAVVIASKDGAGTIADAVRSAVPQADVYVVSDGSTDDTPYVALAAGAIVLALRRNLGKPDALRRTLDRRWPELDGLRIPERYSYVLVIDDDTVLQPGFCHLVAKRLAQPGVAAVGGRVRSSMPTRGRLSWNVWIAARAWATFRTQLLLVRGQSALGARQWISGGSTAYRSDVLDSVLVHNTPYIVDDTFWCMEIQRRHLGRIEFEPLAVAAIQEPTTLRALARQELRWSWGTWQGILGHRIGRQLSRVDAGFLALMIDMALYVFVWPIAMVVGLATGAFSPAEVVRGHLFAYGLCGVIGAIALRRPKLLVLWPALIVYDWAYRGIWLRGVVKAWRQPTVDSCTWESPARYATSIARTPSGPVQQLSVYERS